MHAAKIDRSPRLQRVLECLADGRWRTTREIMLDADVCAVNSCVAELRANGRDIECEQVLRDGRRLWRYRLRVPAQAELGL